MRYYTFAAFIYITSSMLFSVEAALIQEGFLGLRSGLTGRLGSSTINNNTTNKPIVLIPINVIGASELYQVYTNLELASDMLQLGNYYSADSSIVSAGDIYEFSYVNIESSYSMKKIGQFQFLLGVSLGHEGFLSASFSKNTFNINVGPIGTAFWFISKHFALKEALTMPLGLVRVNMTGFLKIKNRLELIFDPKGPLDNPFADSWFLSIGADVDYTTFKTKQNQTVTLLRYRPFISFNYLY